MGRLPFTEFLSLSKTEIYAEINAAEKKLLKLRFKKATRQSFEPHKIKQTKRRLAQLKTLLTRKLKDVNQIEK